MPGHALQLPEAAALIPAAQPFAHKGFILQHSELQQVSGNARRSVDPVRKQRQLRSPVDPLGQSCYWTAVQADQLRILPAVTQPGKGKLHAAVMGDDLHMLRTKPAHQVAGNPEKQRIA
ncbi:hypothetical protein D3C80_1718110 [compost metagenome]